MQLAEVSFDTAIQALKNNGAKFAQVYRDFVGAEYYAKQDPTIYAKWKSAKSKADTVKNTIMYINDKVDGAASWFSSTFGLNGLTVINAAQEKPQGLGFLPLLPVAYVIGASAAVVAAISLMTSVLGDIYEYKRKADLVESGQANSDILNAQDPNSLFYNMGSVMKFGLVLAAAYFIVPQIIKARK